jgi:hypothetical protein
MDSAIFFIASSISLGYKRQPKKNIRSMYSGAGLRA